jgi:type I restriction enzyme S subunit
MANVDETTGTMDTTLSRKLGEVRKGYSYFAEKDIVFAKITPCMENGKSAIAQGLKNGIGFGTTEFHVLRPGPLVISEWLHTFVRRLDFRKAAQESMQGAAGQQRVPIDFLRESDIPVPPIEEQRRIVSRIEKMTRRVDEAHRLGFEIEDNLNLFMKAAYYRMIGDVEWKSLKELATLVRRRIQIEPDEEYEEMGVRSFGKGTFRKPILTGRQIGNKRIYRIHEGDLVFNNVFAWEGAIGVAQPEDHGRVGSHRFITYVPHQGKATSEFLCHHFLSEKGLEDIGAASPGSAGRNRTLGLEKLKNINVPVPDYQKQLRFSEIAKRRRQVQRESAVINQELSVYKAAVIANAFRGRL